MVATVLQDEKENGRIFAALLGPVRSAYSFSNFSIVADHIFGVRNFVCSLRKTCYLNLHYLLHTTAGIACSAIFGKISCHFFK